MAGDRGMADAERRVAEARRLARDLIRDIRAARRLAAVAATPGARDEATLAHANWWLGSSQRWFPHRWRHYRAMWADLKTLAATTPSSRRAAGD